MLGKPRHELKFLIDLKDKDLLLQDIRFALHRDQHAGDTGAYRVSSLYYDTQDLQAMYEKLDGVLQRRKYRLRYYGVVEETPGVAFLEIKHRFANIISKERVLLKPEAARQLLSLEQPLDALPSLLEKPHPPMVARVVEASARRRLLPAVIVAYVREAWVGSQEPDLRVTFDYHLESFAPADYTGPGRVPGRSFLPQDRCVLGIKFDHRLPRWLRQRLVQSGLRPVRFSKYLEACLVRETVAGVML